MNGTYYSIPIAMCMICIQVLIVMSSLQVKFISFELFLDYTEGPNYIKGCKNGSPSSVFWDFIFFLLKLNLGYKMISFEFELSYQNEAYQV